MALNTIVVQVIIIRIKGFSCIDKKDQDRKY